MMRRLLNIVPLIVIIISISPVYGIKSSFSVDSGGVSQEFTPDYSDMISGLTTISREGVSNSITSTSDLTESHSVSSTTGLFAEVGVRIKGATQPYTYEYSLSPNEGKVGKTANVLASQSLNIPNAGYIFAYERARNKAGYAASASTEVTEGSLLGYSGSASASAAEVIAEQRYDSASGTVKTDSRSFFVRSIRAPKRSALDPWTSSTTETDISTSFSGTITNHLASARKSTTASQSLQQGHIDGTIAGTITSGTEKKTRTPNWGNQYDFDLQAVQGLLPIGTVGYYVDPSLATDLTGAIQGGVDDAESGDTLNLAAGIYNENLIIRKSLTINGAGRDNTIIDGNSEGSVFGIYGSSTNTLLTGATITNGNSPSGGGIFHNGGILTLHDVSITRNRAIQMGAGIRNYGGTVNLVASDITSNIADWMGGGIFNDNLGIINIDGASIISGNRALDSGGGIRNGGIINIDGGSITGNIADYDGGGIINYGTMNMVDGSIHGNIAMSGGGGGIRNSGTLNLNGVSITSNIASENHGGGIRNDETGLVEMVAGSITGNNAAELGGGIFNQGTFTLENVDLFGNAALDGGGIYNHYGIVNLIESGIISNTASNNGAGIYNYYGTVNVDGCSIDGNIAGNNGGGIYNYDYGPFSSLFLNGTSEIINNEATTGVGGAIFSGNSLVSLDGTGILVKFNCAYLPDSESSWYRGWGIFLESGIPTTTGGFDADSQVLGNTQV